MKKPVVLSTTNELTGTSLLQDSESESDTYTEITEESITERYKALFGNWKVLTEVNQNLKREKLGLIQDVKDLKKALEHSTEELGETRSKWLALPNLSR